MYDISKPLCLRFGVSLVVTIKAVLCNKRSVLRRQCRNTNRNIKMLVFCRYTEYELNRKFSYLNFSFSNFL